MKIITVLRIMLFTFICAMLCTVGYAITELTIVAWFVAASWIGCGISVLIWLCMIVFRYFHYGINIVMIIISFITSLILGIIISQDSSFTALNNFENLSMVSIVFIIAVVACLVSTMVLVGRYIFKRDDKQITDIVEK